MSAELLALIDSVRAELAEIEARRPLRAADRDAIMRLSIRLGALEEAAELLGIHDGDRARGGPDGAYVSRSQSLPGKPSGLDGELRRFLP